MSDRLNGKTAWEFACDWYTPDQIAHSIKNRYRTPSDTAIPDDIDSAGFAQWLTEQYRLAMAKGIQIAQQDSAQRLAAAEALLTRLVKCWGPHDVAHYKAVAEYNRTEHHMEMIRILEAAKGGRDA